MTAPYSALLAAALGAKVYKGTRREIGWHPVKLTGEAKGDRLLQGVMPVSLVPSKFPMVMAQGLGGTSARAR